MRHSAFCTLLLLAACQSPPLPSTQEQRDAATIALNSAKTAILLLQIDEPKKALALKQIAALQKRVDESGEMPINWVVLYSDLMSFALEWSIPQPKQQ